MQRSDIEAARGGYLHRRLLRINVGFLLSEGPGNSREIPISLAQRVQVDEDLFLESLTGQLILTRTKEGILVQGTLAIAHKRTCDRCLDAFEHKYVLDMAELFAAAPEAKTTAFFVDSNGEIDLAPLLREEVLIEEGYRAVCREDCRGLSAMTGEKLSLDKAPPDIEGHESEIGAEIDPRMAILKQLLQ